MKNYHTIISNTLFYIVRKKVAVVFYLLQNRTYSEVYRVKYVATEKKSVFCKCDDILYLHFISKYAIMKVFTMGGNVKLFQAERDVNCVLSSLSSITEANSPPNAFSPF